MTLLMVDERIECVDGSVYGHFIKWTNHVEFIVREMFHENK